MRDKNWFLLIIVVMAQVACTFPRAVQTGTTLELPQSRLRQDKEKLADALRTVAAKDEITILYTDSGIGGLGVMARDLGRLYNTKSHTKVRSIFANAIFSQDIAFSNLSDEKLGQIFSRFLFSVNEKYRPDLIVVACNTLSVLVPITDFYKRNMTPILDIAETSVSMMHQALEETRSRTPRKPLIYMFATPVTVRNQMYKNELLARGMREEEFVDVPCAGLVSRIESDPKSASTRRKIEECVDSALARVRPTDKQDVYVSLNCTHFPYALDLWKEVFFSRGIKVKEFLNPNEKMTSFLFQDASLNGRHSSTETSALVVTLIPFRSGVLSSIADTIEKSWSPKTASALRGYTLDKELFAWRDLLPDPQD